MDFPNRSSVWSSNQLPVPAAFRRCPAKVLPGRPTLKAKPEPLPTVDLAGMGELHLDVVRDRIKTDFGIDTRAGNGKVEYRDTIAAPAAVTYHLLSN